MKKTLLILFLFSFVVVYAHWADLASLDIYMQDKETKLVLNFPTNFVADYDDNKDNQISPQELELHRQELLEFFNKNIVVVNKQGQSPKLTIAANNIVKNLDIGENTHSNINLNYLWPKKPEAITISYKLFNPDAPAASNIASIYRDDRVENFVFTPQNRVLRLEPIQISWWQQAKSFLILGIKHILTGYDHLLFLLTIIVLGGSLKSLLKIITAFSISHSITLTLAVLNIFTLPARFVEAMIALSIIYVAAENLWRDPEKAARWRWLLTLGFGLIHGLGFAGVLREMALPKASLVSSLLSFNLGVELGQIAIVSVVYFILVFLKRWSWSSSLRWALSMGAGIIGVFWFIERAFIL